VNLAGGIASLLPPQPVDAEIASRILDGLDGLIITGGRDVGPEAMGSNHIRPPTSRRLTTGSATRWRSRWSRARSGGVYRCWGSAEGRKVVNVALGGTLHQHLPDVIGHTHHQKGNAVFSTSAVRTVRGTRLASVIGESSDAQCYHHQAIDRLGRGLVVSAQDTDGVIEAVEIPGDNFVLAVQWHPEERLDDLRLFAAVVEAAAAYAKEECVEFE